MQKDEEIPDNVIHVDFRVEQGQAVKENCVAIGASKTIEMLIELGFKRSYAVAMIKKYAGFLKVRKV